VASALQATRLLKQRSHWFEALANAKQAVHPLPLVNNHSLSCESQQNVVLSFAGLAVDACPLFLQAGDNTFEVLELLKLTCGVAMGLLIDNQSDILKPDILIVRWIRPTSLERDLPLS